MRKIEKAELIDALSLLSSQLRLERLLPAVLDVSLTLTGADRAYLLLVDRQGKLAATSGRNREGTDLDESAFQGSRTILNKVLNEKHARYIPRLGENAEFADAESVRKMHLKSAICIPLLRPSGAPLGVLYVDSASMVDPLLEEHLQLMKALANHVAITIENAKLFEEIERRGKEIEELNRQLQERVEVQAESLADMRMLLEESQRELRKASGLENMIGKSPSMQKVFKVLEKVVRTHATVLITGESGTGKEQAAKYLHYYGPRSEKPMVSINCSAFSDTLLESELFGHRKGAFTGATENKAGLFELANGGTLFLDEVADMSQEMQKKLLRVLQDGEVRPVGSKEPFRVDVRIIAATNKDLPALIQNGNFREDLYFRVNVIHIAMPPLRDRNEDIPLLIDHFSKTIARDLQQPPRSILPEVLREFLTYDWPGNVRQLENELRRVFILDTEYEPRLHELYPAGEADMKLSSIERNAMLKALEAAGGNKTRAAEILGMSRSAFYDKLAKYKIS